MTRERHEDSGFVGSNSTIKGSASARPTGAGVPDGGEYRSLLRAAVAAGSSQLATAVVGVVRGKLIAGMIGASGLGITSILNSAAGLVGTVTGFGIPAAGVRAVAAFGQQAGSPGLSETLLVLRRMSWISGAAGAIFLCLLATPASVWLSGGSVPPRDFVAISVCVLFGSVATTELAILQGMRAIRALALCRTMMSISGAVASVGVLWFAGTTGIAMAQVGTSLSALAVVLAIARPHRIQGRLSDARVTLRSTGNLARYGAAFLATGVVGAAVDVGSRWIIIKNVGLSGAGVYTAVATLATLGISVAIATIGTDLYPSICAAGNDYRVVRRQVNRQIEMASVISSPMILMAFLMSGWVLPLLYSTEFSRGERLLQWQLVAASFVICSWPLAILPMALGRGLLHVLVETLFGALTLPVLYFASRIWGLAGCGIAAACVQALHFAVVLVIAVRVWSFRFSLRCLLAMAMLTLSSAIGLVGTTALTGRARPFALGLAVVVVGVWSWRQVRARVNKDISGSLGPKTYRNSI